MIKLLVNEWLKMKQSTLIFLSLIISIFLPVLIMMMVILTQSNQVLHVVDINEYMGMNLRLIAGTMSICFYTYLASELIVREFRYKTFKSQLTIPISRSNYFMAKVIFASLLTIALIMISYLIGTGISIVMFKSAVTVENIALIFVIFLKTSVLILPFLYFTMLISVVFKSNFVSMTINITLYLSTIVLRQYDQIYYHPWSIPFRLIFKEVELSRVEINIGYITLFILAISSIIIGDYMINKIEV